MPCTACAEHDFAMPLWVCSCTAAASLILPDTLVHPTCVLQELYFRRNRLGPTDWQWSYDAEIWHNTDDLAQVHTGRDTQ